MKQKVAIQAPPSPATPASEKTGLQILTNSVVFVGTFLNDIFQIVKTELSIKSPSNSVAPKTIQAGTDWTIFLVGALLSTLGIVLYIVMNGNGNSIQHDLNTSRSAPDFKNIMEALKALFTPSSWLSDTSPLPILLFLLLLNTFCGGLIISVFFLASNSFSKLNLSAIPRTAGAVWLLQFLGFLIGSIAMYSLSRFFGDAWDFGKRNTYEPYIFASAVMFPAILLIGSLLVRRLLPPAQSKGLIYQEKKVAWALIFIFMCLPAIAPFAALLFIPPPERPLQLYVASSCIRSANPYCEATMQSPFANPIQIDHIYFSFDGAPAIIGALDKTIFALEITPYNATGPVILESKRPTVIKLIPSLNPNFGFKKTCPQILIQAKALKAASVGRLSHSIYFSHPKVRVVTWGSQMKTNPANPVNAVALPYLMDWFERQCEIAAAASVKP